MKYTAFIFLLLTLISCGGDSSGNPSGNSSGNPSGNAGVNTSATTSNSAALSAAAAAGTSLSCNGSRIWGPIQSTGQDQTLLYISETNGTEVLGCSVVWSFEPSVGCSSIFIPNESIVISALNNGDLAYIDGDFAVQLPPANISILDLSGLPDCPANSPADSPTNSPSNEAETPTNGSTVASNGASFGLDLPSYQDLILVNRLGTTPGLDGILLSTIRQIPVVRFENRTATREVSEWLSGRTPQLGSWVTNSSGRVTFNFDGSEFTSRTVPLVASRSPTDFFNCYKQVTAFSLPGANALNFENYCFTADGRFSTNTGGSFVSGSAVGGGQSEGGGTYQVDGNVIRLIYNNGVTELHVFGTYRTGSEPVFAVSIGEAVYNVVP